jgi:hypothetical protein
LLSSFAVEKIIKLARHTFLVGYSSSIFIAGIMETLIKHLFSKAFSRIETSPLTTEELMEGIKTDPDLAQYIRTYSFYFYGGSL